MTTRTKAEERAVGILKRYVTGETPNEIAADLGISSARVRQLQRKGERIERARLGLPAPTARRRSEVEERAISILKRCGAGETLKEIAIDFGVSASRIRQLRMKGERIEAARVVRYERKFGP